MTHWVNSEVIQNCMLDTRAFNTENSIRCYVGKKQKRAPVSGALFSYAGTELGRRAVSASVSRPLAGPPGGTRLSAL